MAGCKSAPRIKVVFVFLREFLYVDTDKVRGLLAQLDEGIIESSTESASDEKSTSGGVKGFADHTQRWGGASSTIKSQGDALFPTLEAALEAEGLLVELSERLSQPTGWSNLPEALPPGTLVRITSQGALFDARYVANTLSAFATTWRGLVNLGIVTPAKAGSPPLKKGQQGSQVSKKSPALSSSAHELEDAIPDDGMLYGGSTEQDAVSRDFLRGIIQVSRGVFTPGLHLNMRPTGDATHTVVARLQEGKQFLDGETDVLFARYGGGSQEWTLVGSVGHYGEVVDGDWAAFTLTDSEDNVNRSVFAELVNKLSRYLGTLGFVDLPQPPGFSVVPLAVYRGIGSPASVGESVERVRHP